VLSGAEILPGLVSEPDTLTYNTDRFLGEVALYVAVLFCKIVVCTLDVFALAVPLGAPRELYATAIISTTIMMPITNPTDLEAAMIPHTGVFTYKPLYSFIFLLAAILPVEINYSLFA
jgi:hypothetical protein